MEIRKLSDDLSVSEQIKLSDLDAVKAAGFRSLVCNRPDGEAVDQPVFSAVEQDARALGLEVRFLPALSGR